MTMTANNSIAEKKDMNVRAIYMWIIIIPKIIFFFLNKIEKICFETNLFWKDLISKSGGYYPLNINMFHKPMMIENKIHIFKSHPNNSLSLTAISITKTRKIITEEIRSTHNNIKCGSINRCFFYGRNFMNLC